MSKCHSRAFVVFPSLSILCPYTDTIPLYCRCKNFLVYGINAPLTVHFHFRLLTVYNVPTNIIPDRNNAWNRNNAVHTINTHISKFAVRSCDHICSKKPYLANYPQKQIICYNIWAKVNLHLHVVLGLTMCKFIHVCRICIWAHCVHTAKIAHLSKYTQPC